MPSITGCRILTVVMLLGSGLGLSACGTGKPPLFNVNHDRGVEVPVTCDPSCQSPHRRAGGMGDHGRRPG